MKCGKKPTKEHTENCDYCSKIIDEQVDFARNILEND